MPNPQGFDVQAAQQAGYSDDEILQHLTQTRKFDVNGAMNAGYSKGDIIQHLATTPAPRSQRVTSADLLKMSPEQRANYELSRSGISAAPPPMHKGVPASKMRYTTGGIVGAALGVPMSDEERQRLGTAVQNKMQDQVQSFRTGGLPAEGARAARDYIQTEAESMNPEEMDHPTIAKAYKKIIAPAAKAGATFLEGQYQPENLALMGAFQAVPTTSAAGRMVHTGAGALWGGQAATGAVQKGMSGVGKLADGDTAGGVEDLTGAAFDAGIAGAVGKDLAKGAPQTANDALELARHGGDIARRGAEAVAQTRPGQMVGEAVQGLKTAWNPEKNITPQQAATKAFRPRNSKTQWNQEIESALPDMRRAADASGVDVGNMTLDDALQSANQAKKDVWAEYENNHLDPSAPIRVPVQPVGDAMRATIKSRTVEQNPNLASRIERNATTYDDRTLSVGELQDRLSQLNNQTRAIEAKYVTDKRAAKLDPKNAAVFAERDTLRSLLNQTLDSATGEGGQALRKRWGALNSVEDVISRRIPVAGRANPVSLTRIFEMLHGPGRIVRGVFSGSPGDIAMGTFNTKAMLNAEKMNDPEWLTQQAFQRTTPTPPAEMREVLNGEYVEPAAGRPRAGLLPEYTEAPFISPEVMPQTPPNAGGSFEEVNNREYGSTVIPVGPRGEQGRVVRAIPLPEHVQEPQVMQPPRLQWGPRVNGRNQLPPMSLYPDATVPNRNAVEAVGIPETAEAEAIRRNYEQKRLPSFLRAIQRALPEHTEEPVARGENAVEAEPPAGSQSGTPVPEFLRVGRAPIAQTQTRPVPKFLMMPQGVRAEAENAGEIPGTPIPSFLRPRAAQPEAVPQTPETGKVAVVPAFLRPKPKAEGFTSPDYEGMVKRGEPLPVGFFDAHPELRRYASSSQIAATEKLQTEAPAGVANSPFAETSKIDWGNGRGQGKRSGGTVKGAMSDVTLRGTKTYTDPVAKLNLTREQRSEFFTGLENSPQAQDAYIQARAGGEDHDAAMLRAYKVQEGSAQESPESSLPERAESSENDILASEIKALREKHSAITSRMLKAGTYSEEARNLSSQANDVMRQVIEREDRLAHLNGEPTRAEKREMQKEAAAKTFAERPKQALKYGDAEQSQPWQVKEADYIRRRLEQEIRTYERAVPEQQAKVDALKNSKSAKRIQEESTLKWWKEKLAQLKSDTPNPRDTQKFRESYIETIKKAISQGKPVPQEVIDQRPEFATAQNARERYEKGRHTSFANRSAAINDTMQEESGYKVKRQDGKPITEPQIAEIERGVADMEKVFGPALRSSMRGTDVTIAHTSGKHPFLTGYGGVYHVGDKTITTGLAGQNALGHETAHWLDYESGAAMGAQARIWAKASHQSTVVPSLAEADRSNPLIPEATRTINDVREVHALMKADATKGLSEAEAKEVRQIKEHLGPYWREPREVFARLVEQYLAKHLGPNNAATMEFDLLARTPGWWTKEQFAKLEPLVKEEIDRRMKALQGKYPSTAEPAYGGSQRPPITEQAESFGVPRVEVSKGNAEYEAGERISGADGREAELLTPSGKLTARYRIVDASELQPSHDALTFAKNPAYPEGVQERAYHTSKEAQNRVIQQAQNYEPSYTINTNPDAVNGPPVITPDGTVLGGNSRAMSTQRLYKTGDANAYRDYLRKGAASFGLKPEDVDAVDNPVLVREVPAPETIEAARRLGSELNKSMTGALGVSERAVSAGKSITQESLAHVGNMLDELGDGATLRALMDKRGSELVRMLASDGVITERERPQFVDTANGGLSEEGKTFVERALLGSVVDDPVLMDSTPKSVLNKLEGSLADISSLGGRTDEYNLMPLLREALENHAEIARNGSTIELHLGQSAMFGPERNPAVDAMVRLLGEKPKEVRSKLRQFTQDAKMDVQGQGSLGMFETPTPVKAFNDAFGTHFTEDQYADYLREALRSYAKRDTIPQSEVSRGSAEERQPAPATEGVQGIPSREAPPESQARVQAPGQSWKVTTAAQRSSGGLPAFLRHAKH